MPASCHNNSRLTQLKEYESKLFSRTKFVSRYNCAVVAVMVVVVVGMGTGGAKRVGAASIRCRVTEWRAGVEFVLFKY